MVLELGTERDPPPYFAGRREQLAALNKRLRRLCETGDAIGGMALIVGVPGAGKTQLGWKFAADAVQTKASLDIQSLAASTTMLKSGIDLFMAISGALGVEPEGRAVTDLDTRYTGRRASIGPLKGGLTQEHARHTGSLPALLNASKHAGMWNGKALVLVVDELQTIEPPGMTALRVLHQGDHGCPILLVGIGLQHTQQVLANPSDGSAGISRVAQPIRLGSLPSRKPSKPSNRTCSRSATRYPNLALPRWPMPRMASHSTSTATWQGRSRPSPSTAASPSARRSTRP